VGKLRPQSYDVGAHRRPIERAKRYAQKVKLFGILKIFDFYDIKDNRQGAHSIANESVS